MTPVTTSIRTPLGGDVTRAAARAAAAERAGFDQIWFGNDVLGTSGVIAVAAASAATSRIGLGVGVFEPVSMHPTQIAMLATGLQQMSQGRLLLGMGAGSEVFFGDIGLSRPAPVRTTARAIIAVRTLLGGGAPADDPRAGSGWGPRARLDPVPATVPPIYVGAMGPQMLAMAGRVADGALPLCLPPERFIRARADIRRGSDAAGRSFDDFDLAACIWCSIDVDAEIARRRLAEFITRYAGSLPPSALAEEGFDPAEFANVHRLLSERGPAAAADAVTSDMMRLGIAGGPADVLAHCRDLVATGARHISFGPPLGPDPDLAMAVLGDEVLPRLQGSGVPAHHRCLQSPAAVTDALARLYHPGGVRLGVVSSPSVSEAIRRAIDGVISTGGLDPRRRHARLSGSNSAADVSVFLDRFGHEYAVFVMSSERSWSPDERSGVIDTALRNGCEVLETTEVED